MVTTVAPWPPCRGRDEAQHEAAEEDGTDDEDAPATMPIHTAILGEPAVLAFNDDWLLRGCDGCRCCCCGLDGPGSGSGSEDDVVSLMTSIMVGPLRHQS